MRQVRRVVVVLTTFCLLAPVLPAPDARGQAAHDAAPIEAASPDAARYHQVLRQRPEPGYLFDRFYHAWLDHGTVDGLEQFLRQQAATQNETADRLLLAFFYVKQGDRVQGLTVLQQALEQDPANAVAWYHKARMASETLQFAAAIEALERAAQAQPDDELALKIGKLRGQLLVRTNARDEARAVWAQLLAQHPDDEFLYEDLIELQIDEGLYDEAIQTSEALIERTRDPYKKVLRRLRIGDIHQRANRRDEALEIYAGTLRDVGQGSWLEREVLAQIEQVFRREEDLTGLRAFYEKLVGEHAQSVTLRRRYADVLVELGDTDEAVTLWRQVLELTPGEREHREAYARVLAEAGRLPEAVEQVEQLIAQHPDDAELLVRLAELQHQQQDADAAAKTLHRYLETSDGSLFAYLRVARLMERFELSGEAEKVYEQMVAAHGEDPAAHEAQAEFLYRIDRKDEALAIWSRLAQQGDRPGALRIARALSARREHEAAFAVLHARVDEAGEDPAFLGELCEQAIHTERYEQALPWARRRLALASNPSGFESALLQAARVAEEAERIDALIEELRALPQRGVAQACLLAELYERRGQSQEADAALAEATPASPQETALLLEQRVRLHEQRRDWMRAAEAVQALIEAPGGRRSANLRRVVQLYERAYAIDEALRWVPEWKKVSPGDPGPWVAQAQLLLAAGRPDESLDTLRQAVQQFEDHEDLRARLAQAYLGQGKLADAERLYWGLYEQSDNVMRKLQWVARLAEVAEQRGRTRDLVELFEQRQRTNEGSVVPYLALAEVHRVNQNYEERRQAMLEASRIKPDDLTLLMMVARIEEDEGDFERALATLERAAELDPSPRARQRMARIYLAQGREEQAYRLLYELAGGDQTDARGIEQIADAMAGSGDWQRVAEFLARHRPRFEGDYRLAYLHAVALEEALLSEAAVDAFLEVLRIEAELPGLNANQQQTYWSGYEAELRALLPESTVRLARLSWQQHMAYQYRYRGQAYYPGAGGGSGATVSPPTDLAAAHDYAIIHLQTIAQLLDEAQRQRVAAAMRDAGVPLAELLVALPPDADPTSLPPELLEQHGDDPAIAAMWVLSQATGQPSYDPERAARYFEMFRQSRPELALLAALAAAQGGEAHQQPLEQALPLLETIERPSVFTLMGIARSLGNGGMPWAMGEGAVLPDETRQTLTDQLVTWYADARHNQSGMGEWVFLTVASTVASSGDLASFVQLLEREITTWRNRGVSGGAAGGGMFAHLRHGQQLLQPMPFPPASLPAMPPHVMDLLGADNRLPFDTLGGPLEPEQLANLLDQVTDPALKVLLAWHAERSDVIEATLEQMLAAESPALDAYLLAASYAAQEKQDRTRAVELLNTARYLPMTAEQRRTIDSSLVAWALEMRSDEAMVEAGRQAALRLRQAPLQAEQREELALALEDLGLSEEAEQLHQAAAQPSGGLFGALGQMFQGGGMPTASQPDRIVELIQNNKTDAAVSLATRQLETWAQASLSGGSHVSPWETRQFIDLLKMHSLVEPVLEKTAPGDGASPLRRMRYARVLEMLERQDEALAIYQELAEQRPNDAAILWRLASLTAEQDPAKAAQHLANIPARAWPGVSQQLTESIYALESLEPLVAHFEMLAAWMAQRPDDDRTDLSWLPTLVDQLVGSQHDEPTGGWLPHLYAREGETPDSLSDLARRREEAARKLAALMLEEPTLAAEGFKHQLAWAEARGEDLAPFVAKAEHVLLHPPDATQRRAAMMAMQMGAFYFSPPNNGEDIPPYRTPGQFLVRDAWQHDRRAAIDQTLLPALRELGEDQRADQIESLTTLYFSAPERFVEDARQFLENGGSRPGAMPYMPQDDTPLRLVIEVWRDRGLEVDPVPLIVEQADRVMRQQGGWYGYGGLASLSELAAALWEQGGVEAVDRLLDALAEKLIGPADKQAELIAQHYDAHNIMGGSINARIHAFTELLGQLSDQDPRLALVVLERYRALGLLTAESQITWQIEHHIDQFVDDEADPQEVVDLLAKSHLLDEAETFAVYQYGTQPEQNVLLYLAQRLDYEEKLRDALAARLAERAPQTFGAALLHAVIKTDEDDRPATVINFLAERADAIDRLPEATRVELASLAPLVMASAGDLTDAGRAVLDRLATLHRDTNADAVAELLEARSLRELSVDPHALEEHIGSLMPGLAERDRERARQVLAKGVALIHEAQRRGTYNVSYGDGLSPVAHFLSGAVDDLENLPAVALAVEITRDGRDPLVEMTSHLRSVLDDLIDTTVEEHDADEGPTGHFAAVCEQVAAHFSPGNLSVLAPHLDAHLLDWDADELAKLIAWAESDAASESTAPALADLRREVAVVGRLILARSGESGASAMPATQPAGHPAPAAYYRGVLADQSLSLPYRVVVAAYVAERVPDPEARFDAARVLAEALGERSIGVEEEDAREILLAMRDVADEHADAWQPVAASLLEGYLQHLARMRRSGMAGHTPYYSIHGELSSLIEPADRHEPIPLPMLMLELALTAGNDGAVGRIAQDPGLSLGQSAAAWLLLVRHGQAEQAATLVRRFGESVEIKYPRGVHYDAALHAALPAFLETLEAPAGRHTAELALAAAPDADGEATDLPTRDERLTVLAQRLDELEGQDAARTDQALMILMTSDAALLEIADALARRVADLDLIQVLLSGADPQGMPHFYHPGRPAPQQVIQQRTQTAIVLAHVRAQTLRGNLDLLLGMINDLAAAQDASDDRRHGEAAGVLGTIFERSVMGRLAQLTPEQVAACAPTCRVLAGAPEHLSSLAHDGDRFREINLLTSALAGTVAELPAWRESLTEHQREAHLDTWDLDQLWTQTQQALLEPEPVTAARRLEVVRGILSYPLLAEVYADDDPGACFKQLVEHKLLTEEEIDAHGGALAALVPDEGRSWVYLAQRLEARGERDAAAALWDKAVAAPRDPTGAGPIIVAEALLDADRAEAARPLIESAEPAQSGWKRRLERLRQRLQETQPPAPPAEDAAPETADAAVTS